MSTIPTIDDRDINKLDTQWQGQTEQQNIEGTQVDQAAEWLQQAQEQAQQMNEQAQETETATQPETQAQETQQDWTPQESADDLISQLLWTTDTRPTDEQPAQQEEQTAQQEEQTAEQKVEQEDSKDLRARLEQSQKQIEELTRQNEELKARNESIEREFNKTMDDKIATESKMQRENRIWQIVNSSPALKELVATFHKSQEDAAYRPRVVDAAKWILKDYWIDVDDLQRAKQRQDQDRLSDATWDATPGRPTQQQTADDWMFAPIT